MFEFLQVGFYNLVEELNTHKSGQNFKKEDEINEKANTIRVGRYKVTPQVRRISNTKTSKNSKRERILRK